MCLAMVNPYCALCQVDFCSFAVFMSESSGLLSLFIAMRRLWLFSFIYFLLLTKMKVNIRPGGQAGAQRALERSLAFDFWDALKSHVQAAAFTATSCALLSALAGALSFFSQRFCLPRFFLHNTRTRTQTHTQNKRNWNHLFKIRFLVTSFINFRFLFIYSKPKTFARLVFALSSRLVSLFRLFGQHINNHLPVAGVTRQTPLPVVAVVIVVGVICK